MTEALLLKPYFQTEAGIVFYRIPPTVNKLAFGERTILMPATDSLKTQPSGKIGIAKNLQNSTACPQLADFTKSELVRKAAGGEAELSKWVRKIAICQCRDGAYCHKEMTVTRTATGFIRTCWHHDGIAHRGEASEEELNALAEANWVQFIGYKIRQDLQMQADESLNLGCLLAWAIAKNCVSAIDESDLRRLLNLPQKEVPDHRESTTYAAEQADPHKIFKTLAQPILKLKADPEPPASFMAKPKEKRFESSKWLQFVKSQPCVCCGKRADDPHHIIGQGRGKMGSKEHDLFVIPLCRVHHNELHCNAQLFEQNYGKQTDLLFRFLDRALSLEALSVNDR
ncbi:DUF968 domain-containing protein [Actinobacillus equuli subsp. haemolyticus]|uniref:DUF968 domain-containing protein n=1 Tax=Actinobacillus equuli TaxID=718 RepID=UPI0024429149|nr:DUF968 domain-containing protein [Actinobacillus equuli]WGE81815.1 DUF968 domain-containing protein [Actinobacillus equuli subsp. haemolyticus]